MRKFTSSIFLLILFGTFGCLKEGCEKTTAPEINFGLLLGGGILILEHEGDQEFDVTADYTNADFTMSYYKVYCSGSQNGPFSSEFYVRQDGTLNKESIGYWDFRMDNTDDYMRIEFILQDTNLGFYNVDYNTLKRFDGTKPYIHFTLVVEHSASGFKLVSNTAVMT